MQPVGCLMLSNSQHQCTTLWEIDLQVCNGTGHFPNIEKDRSARLALRAMAHQIASKKRTGQSSNNSHSPNKDSYYPLRNKSFSWLVQAKLFVLIEFRSPYRLA